jgi:hypothetical protein
MSTVSPGRATLRARLGAMTSTSGVALLALLASLAFYLVSASHFAHEPLRIEENEWPPMARAIAEHGRPVIPVRESHKLRVDSSTRPGEPLRWDRSPFIGAWHPPLYQYALAATMLVLGKDATGGLRLVGVAGLLASCLLLILIAREGAPRRWKLVGAAGAALLLVHPYAIQGSTFLDIDTTLYPPAFLLVLWLAIRYARRPLLSGRELLVLGLAVTLVCWLKLTTAPILGVALVMYFGLARRLRGLVEVAVVLATGAAVFLATYAVWCWATDIPLSYTFDYTFGQKSSRLLDRTQIDGAFKWHTAWFMPSLLLLAGVYAGDAIISFVRTRRPRPMDLLWMFGVGVLIEYVLVSPNASVYQGKYALPALPALALPVAWLVLRESRPLPRALPFAVAGAAGVVAALVMPDLLTEQHYGAVDSLFRAKVVALSAAALVVGWLVTRRSASGVLAVLAALLAGQSVHSYRANVSPLYPVQDTRDFQAAAQQINGTLRPGQIAMVSKDLGFYLRPDVKVIEGHDTIYRGDGLTARVLREEPKIKVYAATTFGTFWMGPAIVNAAQHCFRDERDYGAVTIRLRTARRC